MGAKLDTLITFSIIFFLILIVWSRVMGQKMLDTIIEIKEIIKSMAGKE